MSDDLKESMKVLADDLRELRGELPPEFRIVAAALIVVLIIIGRLVAAAEKKQAGNG